MKKMKITFINKGWELDKQWFGKGLPSDIDSVLLDLSSKRDFANPIAQEGLFVYVHDWTVGRLEPNVAIQAVQYLKEQYGIEIDAVLVLRPPDHKGTDVALISLQNNNFKVGSVAVDLQNFYEKDKASFFKLLKDWYDTRPVSRAVPSSLTKSTPTAKTGSARTADQLTIESQQQEIELLKTQVRSLTARLETVERRLQIQPTAAPTAAPPSSNFFSGLFGSK